LLDPLQASWTWINVRTIDISISKKVVCKLNILMN
jgi:hypothetical protein